MASVNKVILVGNLGKDPETRTFPSGDQIAMASLATTDRWKDKQSGEQRESTEWHRLVFNGRLAEIAAQYLRKGSQVYVEGQIRTRKYQDKDGVEKYATEIRVDQLQMLGSRPQGGSDDGYGSGAGSSTGNSQGSGYSRGDQRPQQQRPASGGQQARNSYAESRGRPQPSSAPAQRSSSGFDDMDDDIPF